MIGVRSDATDGYDPGLEYLAPAVDHGHAGIYHQFNPPEWEGTTGDYYQDYRVPLFPTESMTWQPLRTWADLSYVGATMSLSLRPHPSFMPPDDRQYRIELLHVPAGVTGAPAVGTTWDVALDMDATFTLELPTYRALNGADAYRFGFTTGPANLPGDMDESGLVDFDDVAFFVLGLSNRLAYEDLFGVPAASRGDMDADGDLDFDDIPGFVATLAGGAGARAVPEPGTCALSLLALIGLVLHGGGRRGRGRRTTVRLRPPASPLAGT
ncbi:MAG: hypothetical protein A2W31_12095 [Planctomycetes bacterium RBG_16_64_10]|nr:MAG: hypothetical protein A2W31_12095 [Planctomycetes bacterium RBG_16_64_10]